MVDNVEDEEPARAAPKKGAKGDEEYTDIGDSAGGGAAEAARRGAAEEEKVGPAGRSENSPDPHSPRAPPACNLTRNHRKKLVPPTRPGSC